MGKNIIVSSSAVALSCGLALGLFSAGVSAVEETPIQPRTVTPEVQCADDDPECEYGVMPLNTVNEATVTIIEDGDETEEIVEEDIIEEEAEPAMWPVYLSFGAIGVTILMVIILSLTSKKK